MVNGWDIYWITRLDGINTLFSIMGFTSLVLLIIGTWIGIMTLAESEIKAKDFFKYWIPAVLTTFLFMSILTFTPTTKEGIAIWALPKIVNNEEIKQIPENFAKIVNDKLQDWMRDVGLAKGD